MIVALVTTFRASRKEPLAELLERIHASFRQSGEPLPGVRFVFADSSVGGGISSVDRVRKRFPEMERFLSTAEIVPGQPAYRQLSNQAGTPGEGEDVEFEAILRIAEGIPKSYPFHMATVHLKSPQFGALPAGVKPPQGIPAEGLQSGVIVSDAWWVSGRVRSVQGLAITEAPAVGKKLPPLPDLVQAVFRACGKPQKQNQLVLSQGEAPEAVPGAGAAPVSAAPSQPTAENRQAIAAMARDFHSRIPSIVEEHPFPHQLPPLAEALQANVGQKPGEKKPAIVAAFQGLGYRIRGGSGVFTLRRRTPTNLTVEITIDVGVWSNLASAWYAVLGPGFSARVALPVAHAGIGFPQYPIGDAAQWGKIVENLAALSQALDITLLPAIESLAGPVPEWFEP